MNANYAETATPSAQTQWLHNTAIFAFCANLFSTALANVGMAVFLILFIWNLFFRRLVSFNPTAFPWIVVTAVGLHFGWQVVGLTYTDVPIGIALTSLYSERKVLYILPLILVFVDAPEKLRLLKCFLVVSTVALLLSLALSLAPIHSVFRYSPASVLRSHATQGIVFAMSVFLCGWFAMRQESGVRRALFVLLALAFTLNLSLVTNGRSGYVVFLVLTVWCFAITRGFKGVVLGAAVAATVGVAAFMISPSVNQRMMLGVVEARNYLTDENETSLGRRMVMLEASVEIIRRNTLIGVGTGGFPQHFSALAAQKYTGWRAKPFDDPHNQYLFVWVEHGLIGLATFVFMLFVIVRQCARGDMFGRMAAGCVLAWCATSFFSSHFRTFTEGHLIAFIVGMLMLSRAPEQPANRSNSR